MTMSIQSQRIGCGDHITMSTNTTTPMETKELACKRKDCGDANTTAVVKKQKRAYRRKDCGDTNTSTVMEAKKRTCKRKDCGDASTTTVMEKQKRACRRKDCGGTNTSTVMETKKRTCKRKDYGDASTTTVVKKKRAYTRNKYLPHDLIMEEILTKLPVPTLLKSVLVSKLWYNSIYNDHKRLTYSHFLQSQKQPGVILSLSNVRAVGSTKTGDATYGCHFFRITTGVHSHDNVLRFDKFRNGVTHPHVWELVGYCNGLPCMAQVGYYRTGYVILDPNRNDFLYIFYPVTVGKRVSNANIICHGFGFDSLANEFKLVSIFRTAQKELNFVVFTLGTKSWRNVTATSSPVSGRRGRPVTKIRAPKGAGRSAIFCGTSGCLVWKIITTLGGAGSDYTEHDNGNAVSNEMEMLLSFNLHDEKFQFIPLPTKTTTEEQQKHLLIDYPRLLEFKGSPCLVRIEKESGEGSDYYYRCCDDRQGSSCCCCSKVHLYILKDKVKEVWVMESFDVRIDSTRSQLSNLGHLAPDPCCFCFNNATAPPTRIFSFSNQMLLYWFNGKSLQVYNLRSEKHQLVLPNNREEERIFRTKMNEPRHTFNSGDDDIGCFNLDYQLHCHEENFLSLQTFVPEGVAGVDADVFSKRDRPCSAYVSIRRGSRVFYPFF